jgi:putative flavoprotein involved in K+ transport
MPERVDTVVIGGGQAGLAMSYVLTAQHRDHVVLERGRVGERWRTERWDSLTLLTPNWLTQLPGCVYEGTDPDGFMPRDAMVQLLERYAASFHAPVRDGVHVQSLRASATPGCYLVQTAEDAWEATNVVIATGSYPRGHVPPMSAGFPGRIVQCHASQYRNPGQLPPGAVLIVGSGPSGCQICEELCASGRTVCLALSRYERSLRRYRGKDRAWWNYTTGFFDRTAEDLARAASPYGRNGQLTGTRGGHNLDYRQFTAAGATLLGHVRGIQDGRLAIAPDI